MRGPFRRAVPSRAQARKILVVGSLLVFIFVFFFWRLGSMTPGLGPSEYASKSNSQNIGQIAARGLDAPYHLTQLALVGLLSDGVLALRLASVIAALLIFAFLYLLLRSWFGQTVAVFATLVSVTTPWLIVAARTATPNIMFLWPVVPLTCFVLMARSKHHVRLWWLLLCIAVGLSLYTPGLIWFLLSGILLSGRSFFGIFGRISRLHLSAGIFVAVLLSAPLVISLALEPSRLGQLLLVPADWQSSFDLAKSIGWSVVSLFWQTRDQIDIGINRLPVLNILQIALFVFGSYALASKARNITYILIGLLLFSILASGVNENPRLLILGLPSIAVFMAAGLRYLYIEWRRVFPLNPFAYALAISLISLVVGAHLLYTARYSLIAWPHTAQTRNTYVLE